eukprot:COSAG01_NODE_5449_length_4258_cov_2.190430_5_plen_57_part_00
MSRQIWDVKLHETSAFTPVRCSDVFPVCKGEVSKSKNGSYCYPAMTMDNIKKLRNL